VDVVEMPEEEDREGEEPLVAVDDDREVEDDSSEEDHGESLRQSMMPVTEMRMIPADAPSTGTSPCTRTSEARVLLRRPEVVPERLEEVVDVCCR